MKTTLNGYGENEYGLIKFQIPSLNGGVKVVAGRITRVFENGKVEIKTQDDGYWTIEGSAILLKLHP